MLKCLTNYNPYFIFNEINQKKGISDVAWPKDSKFLVSASDDKSLEIWDFATVIILKNKKNLNFKIKFCKCLKGK